MGQCTLRSFWGQEPKEREEGEDLESDDEPASKKTKQTRNVQARWNSMFPWVEYNSVRNSMFCADCVKHNKKSAFSSKEGSSNFRIDNLRKHDKSLEHKAAVECTILESSCAPDTEYRALGKRVVTTRKSCKGGCYGECFLVGK